MSVFDKLKAYSRKPAAVILATVMATSTIPTTPIAQAVTAAYAESGTQQPQPQTAELKTHEGAKPDFNSTAATITLTNDAFSKKDFISGECKIKKDDLEKWILGHKSEKLQAAVKADAKSEVDAKIKKVKDENAGVDVQVTSDTTPTIDGVTITGVKVGQSSDNLVFSWDGKELNVKSKGDINPAATLSVTATVKYSVKKIEYKLVKQDAVPATPPTATTVGDGATTLPDSNPTAINANGSVEGVSGKEISFDSSDYVISVSASDAWNGQADLLTENAANEVSGLEYKGDSKNAALFANSPFAGLKPDKEKYTDEDGCFEATVDTNNYTVTVKPIKASKHSGPATFNVAWTYPGGKPTNKTTTVTVNPVAKKPLSYSLPGDDGNGNYTYRIKDAQQKKILEDANKAAKNAVADVDGKAPTTDYYSAVHLEVTADGSSSTDKGGTTLKFDVNQDEKTTAEYFNFKIDDAPTANINEVQSLEWTKGQASGLDLKSDNGGSNSKLSWENYRGGLWLNGNGEKHNGPVIASWAGYALSRDVPTEMSDLGNELEMNTLDGDHSENMYALDKDGVVQLIKNVSYRRDTWNPKIISAAVSDNKKVKRPDSITKKLEEGRTYVTKDLQVLVALEDSNDGGAKSGLDNATLTYKYKVNSHDETPKRDASMKIDESSAKGSYLYDLNQNGENQYIKSNDLKLTVYDKAGNHIDNVSLNDVSKVGTPMKYVQLVRNASEPTVTAGFDNNNVQREANGRGYYNANRTFTVSVTDPYFELVCQYDPDQVIATLEDGGETIPITPGMLSRSNGDTWTYSYTFGAKGDADCKVSAVNYQNLAGTPAASTFSGDTFTIDKTAPKLNVSWNNEAASNGKYYNAARTATITVEEHNFDPNLFKIEAPVSAGNGDEATPAQIGGWSTSGDTHTATVTFPGQGVYSLSVSGEDLATNKSESYTSPEFVIDTIKPKIDIQNVINRTAYAGDVAPSASVHDTNLADGTTIEVSKISYPLSKDDPNPYAGAAINTSATDKSVSYLNPAKTKGNDGVYTLTVQAVDLAGNTESEAVTWSVNRFGSTYVISDKTGKMLDKYLKSNKTVDVKVTEINPSGLDDKKTAVELTHDTKNSTLKSGDNYTTDSDTSSGWNEYNYTVKKANYGKDGAYRVLFHSQDTAGNSSENTMEGKNAKKSGASAEINFAVDDTAPIASFVDLASNGKYEENSHKAKVSFEDNLKLAKAQVKVNGKVVATYTGDQLEKNPVREFTLDGSSSKQDVSVVAWDAAGNKSKELKATGVLVTNDSLVLWMNNLPMMIGTIAAVVIVAGGIWFVVAKKRKENEDSAKA